MAPEELSLLRTTLWIVFGIVALGNILYLKRAKVTDLTQFLIMTGALIVWVISIGGPFSLYAWYQSFIGSVILALYTFLIAPIYKGVSVL